MRFYKVKHFPEENSAEVNYVKITTGIKLPQDYVIRWISPDAGD